MDLATVIGIVGSVLSVGRTFPQFLRIVRRGHAAGVSATSLTMGLVFSVGWALYGLLADQKSVVIASSAAALQYCATLYVAKRGGAGKIGWHPALWAGGLIAVVALAGETGLGVALATSSLATGLPQLKLCRTGTDLSGVSAIAWLCGVFEGALWLMVGVGSQDAAIIVWALCQGGISTPILWKVCSARRYSAGALTLVASLSSEV